MKKTKHFEKMKISNKQGPKKSHLIIYYNIDSKNFMNIYKKCTAKPCSFSVNDTCLASDTPLRFRYNCVLGII